MHVTPPFPAAADRDDLSRYSFAGLVRRIAASFYLAGQRRVLSELTDDQLRDIGLSRSEADAEAAKPFWR